MLRYCVKVLKVCACCAISGGLLVIALNAFFGVALSYLAWACASTGVAALVFLAECIHLRMERRYRRMP